MPRLRITKFPERILIDQASDRVRSAVLIGDSLSTGFRVGSWPGMLTRMWRARRRNWFISTGARNTEVLSLMSQLGRRNPTTAALLASVAAKVHQSRKRKLTERLTNTWHFSDQVDEVLASNSFPDLALLWIGHNSMDWRSRIKIPSEDRLKKLADEFATQYEAQLTRLTFGATAKKKRCAIVVFGLINFGSFFEARQAAENARAKDPSLYPFLERNYRIFPSLLPQHRMGMVRLAKMCNRRLRLLCTRASDELRESEAELFYCNAFEEVDVSRREFLDARDAWHPSPAGHHALAAAAQEGLAEPLAYLKWRI